MLTHRLAGPFSGNFMRPRRHRLRPLGAAPSRTCLLFARSTTNKNRPRGHRKPRRFGPCVRTRQILVVPIHKQNGRFEFRSHLRGSYFSLQTFLPLSSPSFTHDRFNSSSLPTPFRNLSSTVSFPSISCSCFFFSAATSPQLPLGRAGRLYGSEETEVSTLTLAIGYSMPTVRYVVHSFITKFFVFLTPQI